MDYRFRMATESDLPQIVAIYNQSIPDRMATADTTPVTVDSRMEWFRKHHPESRPLWVAESNNQIAGWLSFQSFYGRPAYSITSEIGIYIQKEEQGKKLGDKLLQKALEQAPSLGLENLLAFVFEHNEPSLRLFKKYGFEVWGKLPEVARMDEKNISLLILGKKIK
jgi:L-amino acid N-acyltransferase YncA